jgi:hypothetical protein
MSDETTSGRPLIRAVVKSPAAFRAEVPAALGGSVPYLGPRLIDGGSEAERARFRHPSGSGEDQALSIDCNECVMQYTEVCGDCVVSFVVSRSQGDALIVDAAEARAVRLLTNAGLLPSLRHEQRVSGE